MKLTHNSLATVISWLSSCLLAGGLSTLFNESARTLWMTWGSFGLAAAVGLDVTARVRERMRNDKLNVISNRRYERDMKYENDDRAASLAVRDAVDRILGKSLAARPGATPRRDQRRDCNLKVELHLPNDLQNEPADRGAINTQFARLTNLSPSGFELTVAKSLPRRRMEMVITAVDNHRQRMFGEILWDFPKPDGSVVAGGRFLDAAPADIG